MSIEEIVDIVSPPTDPIAVPPWELARAEVGFNFPADYRAFVDRCGSGSFHTVERRNNLGIQGPSAGPSYPNNISGFSGFVDTTVSDVRPAFSDENGEPIIRQQNPSFERLLGPALTWILESDWLSVFE